MYSCISKIGDKVVCIDAEGSNGLVLGEIYSVYSVDGY